MPPGLTKDGYEAQFGTNHVGHFLFTKLLLPTMLKTAEEPNSDVRIVNLSSEGHKFAPSGGFDPVACSESSWGVFVNSGSTAVASSNLFLALSTQQSCYLQPPALCSS